MKPEPDALTVESVGRPGNRKDGVYTPWRPRGFLAYVERAMQASQTAPARASANAQAPGAFLPARRILVVEDDGDMRRLNTEVLIHSGYQVDGAADGAAGWEAINANRYDLLITDNGMPKLTGLDLLKKLRSARVVLPVIMATGVLPEHEFAQSPWLVPDATLLKPYTVKELLATVQGVLQATDSAREPIAPPPSGQSQPAANGSWQAFKLSIFDSNPVDPASSHRGNPP